MNAAFGKTFWDILPANVLQKATWCPICASDVIVIALFWNDSLRTGVSGGYNRALPPKQLSPWSDPIPNWWLPETGNHWPLNQWMSSKKSGYYSLTHHQTIRGCLIWTLSSWNRLNNQIWRLKRDRRVQEATFCWLNCLGLCHELDPAAEILVCNESWTSGCLGQAYRIS